MESVAMHTNTTTTIPPSINPDLYAKTNLNLLTPLNILTTLLFYLTLSITISFIRSPKYPTTIPWVGHGPGWLASILNVFTSFSNSKSWMETGYNKHTKHGRSFVFPGVLGSPAEIVVPRSELRWMLDQPDDVLSTSAAHYDLLRGDYAFGDRVLLGDPYHEHVIHKSLARNMNGLIPMMGRGIPRDVDFVLGGQVGDWKSVNVLDSLMKLVPRASNRMLVGEPACSNEEYLSAVAGFMGDVVRAMFLFGVVPSVLHPVVGAVAGLWPRYHFWVSSKHSLPLIKQRLIDIERKESGDPAYKDWKEPNDFITWQVKVARSENRQDELEPTRIAKRVMPLNFAAIHTTSMTSHGAILDILSADPSVLLSLREEASRVYTEDDHTWTKAGLARMYRLDSALRESQRFSSFAQTFVHRKVMAPNGITKPDGVFCAYGTLLAAPWVEVSRDSDLHGEQPADFFDAFRYSRPREVFEGLPVEERDEADKLKVLQSGQVTTSDKHLPFGHGRHACPGRFFVSYLQKIVLAHLILNYDLKHLPERPQGSWIGKIFVPPYQTKIEIRRRSQIWTPAESEL